MNLRTAINTWAGAGAAENARRSLDEWSRAQDEVSAMLNRLGHRTEAPSATSATSTPGRHGAA
jgi:hypothetical protein